METRDGLRFKTVLFRDALDFRLPQMRVLPRAEALETGGFARHDQRTNVSDEVLQILGDHPRILGAPLREILACPENGAAGLSLEAQAECGIT